MHFERLADRRQAIFHVGNSTRSNNNSDILSDPSEEKQGDSPSAPSPYFEQLYDCIQNDKSNHLTTIAFIVLMDLLQVRLAYTIHIMTYIAIINSIPVA